MAKQESIVFGIAGPCDDLESDEWEPMSYKVEDSSSMQTQQIMEISRLSAIGYFVWTHSSQIHPGLMKGHMQ